MPRAALQALWRAIVLLSFAPAHAAVLDCELNGESVNPSNGSTTRGKTGIMKCVDRETRKFVREEEFRNGEPIGHRKSVDYTGKTTVGNYNAQRNRDGEYKEFDADGNLLTEERYANGKRLSMTALAGAGVVARSEEVQDDRRTLRQHHPEGALRLETVVVGNSRLSERELAKSGQVVRDERRGPVGLQHACNESGVLASEAIYEKGVLTRRKSYKDGTLVLDDDYFEDGSRKSSRKPE